MTEEMLDARIDLFFLMAGWVVCVAAIPLGVQMERRTTEKGGIGGEGFAASAMGGVGVCVLVGVTASKAASWFFQAFPHGIHLSIGPG